MGTTAAEDTEVRAAVAEARRRVVAAAERAGRDPGAVRIVAVTKTVGVERIAEAVDAGLRDIGENRVQEAAAKRETLAAPGLRWHLIGHLQMNKAGRAASLFDTVQSVDSPRIAAALAARRPPAAADLDVLLEVELTGLSGHTGFGAASLAEGLAEVARTPRLRVRGLMTMAPPMVDPQRARPTFARLRTLRDDLEQRLGMALPELSMGMSDDFEVAVEEGSTMVRLGRVLFGARRRRDGDDTTAQGGDHTTARGGGDTRHADDG